MTRPQPARRRLLATLHSSGPISDRSGRATSLLAEAMGYESRPVSLSPLLAALEEDGLVRRDVRGRRCFVIELTSKGRAVIDLDVELDSRHIGSGGDDRAPASTPTPAVSHEHPAPAFETADGRVELLRKELHDVFMELGALRHRVAELEHQVRARAGTAAGAPIRPQEGVVESFPESRTG